MTKTIYKYTLTHNVTEIDMPATGVVLTVQVQGDEVVLWAMIDPKEELKKRIFRAAGTGEIYTFDESVYPVTSALCRWDPMYGMCLRRLTKMFPVEHVIHTRCKSR